LPWAALLKPAQVHADAVAMPSGQTADHVRRRSAQARAMAVSGWWGLGTMGIALPYAVIAGGRHQNTLVAVAAAGVLMSVALGMTATVTEEITRWRKPVMLTYATAHIGLTALLAILDGGADSPMALGFFGTLTFSACTMPLGLLAIFGPLNLSGYLAVYLVAGAHRPAYVPVALAGMLATSAACAQQHQRLLRQRRQLFEIARIDPLTGCLNRRGFDEQLQAELDAARTAQHPLTLLVLDLDDFKSVNDQYGHAAGDQLLIETAQTLRRILGPGAPIARIGGDEFAAIITDALGLSTGDLAAHLEGHIDASIGLAGLSPDDHTSEMLFLAADRRLYQRKAIRKASHRQGRLNSPLPTSLTPSRPDRMPSLNDRSASSV
jgi:diguanylate cyclase (GGDEF)-like protein